MEGWKTEREENKECIYEEEEGENAKRIKGCREGDGIEQEWESRAKNMT